MVGRGAAVDAARGTRRSSGVAGALRRYGASSTQQLGLVRERKLLGARLEEEVERVEDRHLGDQVDLDLNSRRLLREHQPRQVVATADPAAS